MSTKSKVAAVSLAAAGAIAFYIWASYRKPR